MFLKFCIMGDPVAHSKSPWIHQQFAQQFLLNLDYGRIKPEAGKFIEAVEQFRLDGGNGFNITQPFKQQAFQLAHATSERAAIAKAVNTILFMPDGKIFGDNTDGAGFIQDITRNHHYSLFQKKILMIGAGGAIRGILQPLLSQNPDVVIIANRTLENARQLANEFSEYGNIRASDFEDLKNLKIDMLIDGSPSDAKIQLPSLSFSAESFYYDLKYENAFSLLCTERKCKVAKRANGFGMLVEQAAESFYLWTQQKPDTKPVLNSQKIS
jgi:shikimate dehydrogenase